MANLLIKVEKEDINTNDIGINVIIQCKNNIDLIFTPEALEELICDFEALKLRNKNKNYHGRKKRS